MVYYVMARGGPGFQIMSEDNRMTIFIDNFYIDLNLTTIIVEISGSEKKQYMGKIKFETENEIVIKNNIAYIK
jgi:hypothetical protein